MNTNIYKCVKESDLDEILNDNAHTLVTIMYVTKQTDPQNKLKRCIVDLASEHKKCMFIYIDIESYFGDAHKITKTITTLPTTFIYLNNNNLATIEGNCVMTIKKTHIDVIQMVSKKINLSNDAELRNDDKTLVKINNEITHETNAETVQPTNEQNVIDEQQLLMDERRNNENTFKIKKVKNMQQMLNIKQLERLKKLKEMEERNDN